MRCGRRGSIAPPSVALAKALGGLDGSPWAEWRRGTRAVSDKQLSGLLWDKLNIRSIRLPDGETPKGFHIEQFADAFARYAE